MSGIWWILIGFGTAGLMVLILGILLGRAAGWREGWRAGYAAARTFSAAENPEEIRTEDGCEILPPNATPFVRAS